MEDNAVLSIGEILLTYSPNDVWASQVALVVKSLPANAGDLRDIGLIPGWEDPLEKEMGTHSSILAWRTPWTEEPGGLQFMDSQRVRHDLACIQIMYMIKTSSMELKGKTERWQKKVKI